MKIGTDGILLGAWASSHGKTQGIDIGTGTGVIAIMMCQKNPLIKIDAIEISEDAAKDALLNFNNCKWKKNISLLNKDLKKHLPNYKYDLIVSNPPYFNSGYLPNNKDKSLAKHIESLSYNDVLNFANKQLNQNGTVNLILPYSSYENCKKKADEHQLYCKRECIVYPNIRKAPSRILLEFSKEKHQIETKKLIIEKDNRHDYTEDYKKLTRDFYTIFN